ncbi:MAG: helix-turn-helix transcriptional regulator [bacterium]|nr:helix-turn-helix transcriptional regulator [bacterium]
MENEITINKRLKAVRESLGLNQTELAHRLGSSPTAISELEKGKYKPNYDMLERLAVEFKVNLYYLFFGVGEIFSEGDSGPTVAELLRHADVSRESFLKFLGDLQRSPYLLLSIMSHYRFLLSTAESTVQKEFEDYEKKKGGGDEE